MSLLASLAALSGLRMALPRGSTSWSSHLEVESKTATREGISYTITTSAEYQQQETESHTKSSIKTKLLLKGNHTERPGRLA
jgi:hypothetical protein